MCAAVLDNVFGIDRPTATVVQTPVNSFVQQAPNPNAASTQSDLTPTSESADAKAKRRGTSSLRIDRSVPASGLNIPLA